MSDYGISSIIQAALEQTPKLLRAHSQGTIVDLRIPVTENASVIQAYPNEDTMSLSTPLLRRFTAALLFALLTASTTVQAHKLNMFAFVEDEEIYVEVYFADGKRAKNSVIEVYDPQDKLLYNNTTDEEGGHQFAIPQKTELRIVVNAGMGHQTEYTLPSSEFSTEQTSSTRTLSSQTTGTTTPPVMQTSALSMEQLKPLITQAVSQAVKPLQREISELKNKTSLSDIIGGVGYIFGLLGIFAYLDARKKAKNNYGKPDLD